MSVIFQGDCLDILKDLASNRAHCCITSPPYWGLRDYGVKKQLGMEATPELYVSKMVEVFREVKRVLRPEGTLWLNIGDSYAGAPIGSFNGGGFKDKSAETGGRDLSGVATSGKMNKLRASGLKPKDLVGIPWLLAFALRADGWYLRQDIIWHKPNPMPESVTDRCTKSHEYIFLLTKQEKYYYDKDAIAEPLARPEELDRATPARFGGADKWPEAQKQSRLHSGNEYKRKQLDAYRGSSFTDGKTAVTKPTVGQGEREEIYARNKRSVWTIAPAPFSEAHFATFPPALVEPCIKAGTSERGCCDRCGAPWVRVTERTFVPQPDIKNPDALSKRGLKGLDESNGWGGTPRGAMNTETKRWEESCQCNGGIVPCTVLDPFSGAGTTGLVAARLGRNYTGIELNPKYIEMSRNRIVDDAPLFNSFSDFPAESSER